MKLPRPPTERWPRLPRFWTRRGSLTSVTAAIRIKAAPGFLFCAALNEDEEKSTGLPDYIGERTLPAIRVGRPAFAELMRIVKSQMNADSDLWLQGFSALFHQAGVSPRTAIKLITTAVKIVRYLESGSFGCGRSRGRIGSPA